jgi:hypothetical protein
VRKKTLTRDHARTHSPGLITPHATSPGRIVRDRPSLIDGSGPVMISMRTLLAAWLSNGATWAAVYQRGVKIISVSEFAMMIKRLALEA